MSGIARSNMPLLLNTTYIESLLFRIASSRFGYFSFGIIRSISCKEISLAFVKAFCSAFSLYNALLCLSLASSSWVVPCSGNNDSVPVFGSGFQSDFWRLAEFDCWLLVTDSAGVSAGSLSSWESCSLYIVCRPLLPTVIVCYSGDSVPVFGSGFDTPFFHVFVPESDFCIYRQGSCKSGFWIILNSCIAHGRFQRLYLLCDVPIAQAHVLGLE